eukprot:6271280-Amphidinium_carterae.1
MGVKSLGTLSWQRMIRRLRNIAVLGLKGVSAVITSGRFQGTLFAQADQKRPGTHSMKNTLLSWCAKAGIAEGCHRLLGRHVKPKDRSVL